MSTKIEGSKLDFSNLQLLRIYMSEFIDTCHTGVKSRLVYSQSSLLQDIEKGGLSSVIETKEQQLSALLIQTYSNDLRSLINTEIIQNIVKPVNKEHWYCDGMEKSVSIRKMQM